MEVLYRKKFLKDLANIPSGFREKIEFLVFESIPKTKVVYKLELLEKLKGYSEYYKIRSGPYRIGIKIEDDVLIFERILHRKEIYRYFP